LHGLELKQNKANFLAFGDLNHAALICDAASTSRGLAAMRTFTIASPSVSVYYRQCHGSCDLHVLVQWRNWLAFIRYNCCGRSLLWSY